MIREAESWTPERVCTDGDLRLVRLIFVGEKKDGGGARSYLFFSDMRSLKQQQFARSLACCCESTRKPEEMLKIVLSFSN